jgi:hypothetical protein
MNLKEVRSVKVSYIKLFKLLLDNLEKRSKKKGKKSR